MQYSDIDAIQLIERYLLVCKKLIKELQDIKDAVVKKHHRDCRISNTAGSVAGAFGSGLVIAGIATAPATLGLSSVLSFVGLGIGVAGAVTSYGTLIGDYFVSRKLRKKFEALMEERNKLAKDLDEFFEFIQEFLKLDNENDSVFAFKLASGGISTTTKIYKLIKAIREAILGIETAGNVGILKGFFILRPFLKVTASGKALIIAGKPVVVTVKTIRVLGMVGIGVISAFTVIDLAVTLSSWSKSNIHPVGENIDENIKKIKQSMHVCKDILRVMELQEITLKKKIVRAS